MMPIMNMNQSTIKKEPESNLFKEETGTISQIAYPEPPLTRAERDAVARGVIRINERRESRKGD